MGLEEFMVFSLRLRITQKFLIRFPKKLMLMNMWLFILTNVSGQVVFLEAWVERLMT